MLNAFEAKTATERLQTQDIENANEQTPVVTNEVANGSAITASDLLFPRTSSAVLEQMRKDRHEELKARAEFEAYKAKNKIGNLSEANTEANTVPVLTFDEVYYQKLIKKIVANQGAGEGIGRFLVLDENSNFKVFFREKRYFQMKNSDYEALSTEAIDELIEFIEQDAMLITPRVRCINFIDGMPGSRIVWIKDSDLTQGRMDRLFTAMTNNNRLEKIKFSFYKSAKSSEIPGLAEKIAAVIRDKHHLRILKIRVIVEKDNISLAPFEAIRSCPNIEYLNICFYKILFFGRYVPAVTEENLISSVLIINEHILKFSRLNTVSLSIPLNVQVKTIRSIFEPLHSKSINLILEAHDQNEDVIKAVSEYLSAPTWLLNAIDLSWLFPSLYLEALSNNRTLKRIKCWFPDRGFYSHRTAKLTEKFEQILATNMALQRVEINWLEESKQIFEKLRTNQTLWLNYLKNLCPTLHEVMNNKFNNAIIALIADYIDEYRCDLDELQNPLTCDAVADDAVADCHYENVHSKARKSFDFKQRDFLNPGIGLGLLWLNKMDPVRKLVPNQIDLTQNNWRLLGSPNK